MTFVSVHQNVIHPIRGREVGGNEGDAADFVFFYTAAIFKELSCHYWESEWIWDLEVHRSSTKYGNLETWPVGHGFAR